jgi:dual specificity phosphatase 12
MQVSGGPVTLWLKHFALPVAHVLSFGGLPIYRRPLSTSQYLIPHTSPPTIDVQGEAKPWERTPRSCAHYFLDPLSWMRPELEQGKLDGRLECPKCHTNVGKYAWQGMQCSCNEWVVPGISLSKSRVDEARKSSSASIRRPPGSAALPLMGQVKQTL